MEERPGSACSPRPSVSEPECRYHVQRRRFWSPVEYRDSDRVILWRLFRVFHKYVDIPVIVEYSGIEQFVLQLLTRAAPICLHLVSIRELRLWILVEIFHVGM